MIILLYCLFVLYFFYDKHSVFTILIGIYTLSGIALIILDTEIIITQISSLYNLTFTFIILSLFILPWRNFQSITDITGNKIQIENLFKPIFIFCAVLFLVLLSTAILVIVYVPDINTFKYGDGVSETFFYEQLPFNIRWFILGSIFYILSYFFIPLHFYFLIKKNKILSWVSLILSLNIILFGLTFFSRWTLTHYFLIFVVFLFLFRNVLPIAYRKSLRYITIVAGFSITLFFINITEKRFSQDDSYSETIPIESKIQDPQLFSSLDYLSQWYNYNLLVLDKYEDNISYGQASFAELYSFFSYLGIIEWNPSTYSLKRQSQLGSPYYFSFIGLTANLIYDFGYFVTFFFALFYYYLVNSIKPINGNISIDNLFLSVLLIQLPLFSIFYSFLAGLIIPLLFYFLFKIYLIISNR